MRRTDLQKLEKAAEMSEKRPPLTRFVDRHVLLVLGLPLTEGEFGKEGRNSRGALLCPRSVMTKEATRGLKLRQKGAPICLPTIFMLTEVISAGGS